MRCRVATIDDAPAIAALHAASWRAAYRGALRDAYLDGDVDAERRAVWNERLGTPAANQYVVVATDDAGTVVGFACAFGADDARWGTQVDNLHVRREQHRQGTGRRLLADVAGWCTPRYPESGLYLWVVEQNAPARAFYERLGGRAEDTSDWEPPGGGVVLLRRYVWPRRRFDLFGASEEIR
jgi:GNAT superfamily N-acetyltransferase